MSRLLKNLGLAPRSARPRVWEVEVARFEQVGPLLYWAEPATELRLRIPMEWLRMQGAFAYAGGWQPFIAALQQGEGALAEFYRLFTPSTFSEMYFLDTACDAPPWELPWLERYKRLAPPGEAGLGAEHGVSFYGPATPEKVLTEMERLRTLDASIRARGFDPDAKGGIAGHFMRRDNEYRFFLRSGKHRTAVLAHHGVKTVPVGFRKNWPRVVDRNDAANWPLVRTGTVTQLAAESAFDRYFDFDGTQQRTKWTAAK